MPADPADVGKVILEEEGDKARDDPMPRAALRRLSGSWEMNWMAFDHAHDLLLPGSTRGRIAFLTHPQAETASDRIDRIDPEHFRYQIGTVEPG
ncbi:MAG TPA: hypothetical protein VMG32_01455 [Anaeromyxobacteraceae bacterium]|nr:hypothetical protein [Anaeromyxobacteraceae bacterium]